VEAEGTFEKAYGFFDTAARLERQTLSR